ncbi:alpha-L-fucosidase [Parabacteroides sp. PF5-5]|uniref:alpha-L-fucosidase n=1 Tax=unclassified Parabacteroides TaxID=2649774 RepID=UPI002476E2BA|nr:MULTISPECIES: alpha-L-fucosidase [unclassified Parabacteroides]MDH6305946.1 alpha-L-fucosidase [Parabacteroides sp. PH5-39]MDH6317202.1 alpha-L-fucosidase [Parabacteroides sp. PF5-13]MDH6320658.1 alpha-L-fucosidase [Parabacteroides sp. PH5-13]MDH6324421.1 alpha-L-fucosidase [Parabacteroides sp. PH5-8]MDH6328387.1 alpha-L-fucosidase [Parabacteroides sp. PH5-41]
MIKKSVYLLLILLCASCQQAGKTVYDIDSVASPKGTAVFQPTWENIAENYQFPTWFTDAKFGIFIHWGVYAVPAFDSEWYPRNMYQQDSRAYKHHIEKWGPHDEFGYKDFVPMFKAEKFDAAEWAALFKEAGAKYVVPVAEHHDGFSMYDSELNEWNAVAKGPQKDILGLLKKEIEAQGLVFGLSTHRAENAWFYNGGMNFPSDVQDMNISLYGRRYADESYTEELAREWLTHTYELINKYEPKLIWFDWTVNNPVLMPYFNKFMAYYYNNALDWGQHVVVNTKQGYPTNVHVWDVERGKSGQMMQFPWQTDTSVGKKSWSYVEGEENKTPEQIVHDLIDIVSKNGNLLLNIGPRADGTITKGQKEVLLSIGEWLKVNGEAIYGTRCWKKFGEGNAEPTKGSFTDNEATAYTAQDIRFTTKGNDFYAIVLNWDDAGTLIKSLNKEAIADAKILNVTLLGSDEKISWEQTNEGLKLRFPPYKPCEYAYAFKISFDKEVGKHLPSEAINEVMKHGS